MAKQEKPQQVMMSNNPAPIRLLVDAHVFDNEYQGTRTFIYETYRRLSDSGAIELYIAATDTERLKAYFPGDRVRFLKYRLNASWFRLLVDLPLLIRKHRIQYAHFQYMVPPIKNCRFIVTIHDVLFLDFPQEFSRLYRECKTLLYRMGARSADILTVNSVFSGVSVSAHLGIRKENIHLTPMAVDERYFRPYSREKAREAFRAAYGFDKFILCVSRIEPRKNHVLLLQVYLHLQLYNEGIHLVLLGHQSIPSPAFDQLLAGLDPAVRAFIFTRPAVTEAELLLFYQAATLFVYPSKAEGFGIPPLEAAAARVPVVCSNTSAMAAFDFFAAGHVDPNDHHAFEAAVKQKLEHPPAETALESIALVIRQKYSWDATAQQLQELILANAEATGITA